MTKELDDTLRKLDQQVKVREYFEGLGCSEEQCDIAVRSFGHDEKVLKWSGAVLHFVQPDGVLSKAAFDPACRKFFEDKYPFLLPAPKPVPTFDGSNVAIDPEVIDRALAGNLTAKGQVARAFGTDSKAASDAELFLKAEAVKRGGGSGDPADKSRSAENPWTAAGWNLTKQGQVAKSDLALAQRLAKSAGSYLGATKPARAA